MALDITSILKIAPYIDDLRNLWQIATTNEDWATKARNLAGPIAQLLEELGTSLFPEAAGPLHMLAGFLGSFNTNGTKWLQGALNKVLPGMGWTKGPLEEDGYYGPLTKEAVKFAQEHYGLTVDGLAGQITIAALEAALAALK